MVFYRKYRPQTIDELDSATVRETLQSTLSKDPSHAFLFTGPKGLGKTSTARIVAKVVNCTGRTTNKQQLTTNTKNKSEARSKKLAVSSSDIEPCNKCEQCISTTNGTNVDVLEIDAASNRGIDEVHMLTTEAFNALLKTLEEPPSHAMFILCTTEVQKVPATIISRCLHVNFSLASKEELIRSFKRVVKAEKINIDDAALEMIANLSEGGFRDGIKILEEVLALSKGKITEKFIEEKYKVSGIKYLVFSMLEALAARDANKGLQIVSELVEKGIDIKHFMQQLMELLHEKLLLQVAMEKPTEIEFSIEEIRILFDLLSKAYTDIKNAVIQQLPLELAIIEYSQRDAENAPIDMQNYANGGADQHGSAFGSANVSDLRKQVGNIKKIRAMYGPAGAKQSSVDEKKEIKHSTVELMNAPASGSSTEEWLENLWKNIISEMKTYNHTVAGVLRGCRIASYDKKNLTIEASFKFHKERLDDIKTKDELSRICKMLTGRDIAVVVELKK